MLEESKLSEIVCRELSLDCKPCDMRDWIAMLERISKRDKTVKIAIVGKYVRLHDAYLSVAEALNHAGYENGCVVEIQWIDAEEVNENSAEALLGACNGILVPGGFGDRGIQGKLAAAGYARENNIPYLGICLGMQIAVIEFAQSKLGLAAANSSEFEADGPHPVIDLMPDQHGDIPKGGTMRLGAYPCRIKAGSMMEKAYGKELIQERHRHRYEFNNQYRDMVEEKGMMITGTSPDGRLVEAVEIPGNDFFIGVQYHPEFKSRPNQAHPLFREFVKSALFNNSQDRVR
jgi:CTP synthase